MFSASLVHFEVIRTGWVRKNYSVKLIRLQRQRADAVDVIIQRRYADDVQG
jgi:hypothetical protein